MPNYCCDVVVHIDEDLSDNRIHQLEKALAYREGVLSACVHENARHLMLVDYDPSDISSVAILDRVTSQGLHAELVGL